MTLEERSRLETLDTALRSDKVREHIRSVVARVRDQLASRKEALMCWEPIPLDLIATTLPPEIRSAWVFVLRAGANTGAEKHPNSHQRMISFEGSGDLQPVNRESGNRMFWLVILSRRWNGGGFQFRRMFGIGR
jgi:hypothetical protein